MIFGLPSIGKWLGEKLTMTHDALTREEIDLMSSIELIHTIEQLQVKLDAERKSREELGQELLRLL